MRRASRATRCRRCAATPSPIRSADRASRTSPRTSISPRWPRAATRLRGQPCRHAGQLARSARHRPARRRARRAQPRADRRHRRGAPPAVRRSRDGALVQGHRAAPPRLARHRGVRAMITYRDATPADAAALATLGADSFRETFGHLYDPADLALFLANHMPRPTGRAELSDPGLRGPRRRGRRRAGRLRQDRPAAPAFHPAERRDRAAPILRPRPVAGRRRRRRR